MNQNELVRFSTDVSAVMAMRLTALPLWWLTDPARANRETRRMFAEKEDAWLALQQQILLAPTIFCMQMWQGVLEGDPDGGLARASRSAEQSLSIPFTSRVRANRKRLARAHSGG